VVSGLDGLFDLVQQIGFPLSNPDQAFDLTDTEFLGIRPAATVLSSILGSRSTASPTLRLTANIGLHGRIVDKRDSPQVLDFGRLCDPYTASCRASGGITRDDRRKQLQKPSVLRCVAQFSTALLLTSPAL
jgi:hypothetical protein